MVMVPENLSREKLEKLISGDDFFGNKDRFEIRWRLDYDKGRHKNAAILLKIPGKKFPIEVDKWTSNYKLIDALTVESKRQTLIDRVLAYERNPDVAGIV